MNNTKTKDGQETVITPDVTAVQEKDVEQQARSFGVPYITRIGKIPPDVVSIISEEVAKKNEMVSFERDGKKVKVAMSNPSNVEALNILRFIAENKRIEFDIYFAPREMINEALDEYSGNAEKAVREAVESLQDEGIESLFEDSDKQEKGKNDSNNEMLQDAPITKLLSVIIRHGIEGKASDIHVEPVDKVCRIRFRVDGVLHSSLTVPKEVGRAVVSRIKILSNLKIDERRKPQDGRFKIVEDGKQVDFRVSTLPVVDGEKVVLRLLDKNNKAIDIEAMGLMGTNKDILMKHIRDPYGIILITGPTGSGKSTTLYAFLQILNQEERNIITLEDPVEYSISGINQSQIKPEIGYTFASGLRSILRQDPNVIMVGEIRDSETAELTIHAALTGHLVFSTLHTNSAIGSIPRLIDMGIESFLLSSSLRVAAAQRLVRRICEKCKKEIKIPESVKKGIEQELASMSADEVKLYGVDVSKGLHFFEGEGCEECTKSGYKGRIAIFEALEIDAQLREIIAEKNGNEGAVKRYAQQQNIVTMKQDGILKVLLGYTTLAEVERVTEGSLSVGGDVDDDMG